MQINKEGWLVVDSPSDPKILRVPAHPSRMGGTFNGGRPLAPVWHTTDVLTPAERSAHNWQDAPRPGATASAHVIIGRSGAICQCVSLQRIAFHVKGGGLVAGQQVEHVNHCTIGIELENLGGVRRILDGRGAGGFYGWPYYRKDTTGKAQPELGPDPLLRLDDNRAAMVQLVSGRYCDGFTLEQLAAAGAFFATTARAFGWKRDDCRRGHVDYEPERKEDPWPLFRSRHLDGVIAAAFTPPT